MSSWLPEIEGWVKVAGAAVAVVMAALVPIRSWIAEDRRHRAQTLEALTAATRSSGASTFSGTSHVLADSLALGAVADGLREVARSLRRLAEEEERSERRLARAVADLMDEAPDQRDQR